MESNWLNIWKKNKGATTGALVGLVVAVLFIFMGIIQTLFIVLCIGIGYYIGDKLSKDKINIMRLLDRILPPGTYR